MVGRYDNLFKGKLTNDAFDKLIADTFPGVTVIKTEYGEEGNEPGVEHELILYYYQSPTLNSDNEHPVHHVGTYRVEDSECWIFNHAFEHPELAHLR
jgi:hypothetical protein